MLVHQIRKADDYALPNWVMRHFRAGTVHDWVLIASAQPAQYPNCKNIPASSAFKDERGMLRGGIFFVTDPGRKALAGGQGKIFKRSRKRFRHEMHDIIRAALNARDSTDNPTEHNERASELMEDPFGLPTRRIEFALMRTGEARFWIDDMTGWTDESFRAVVTVAYLFLKDIAHRHEHHHPSQDSILPITRINGKEIEWQRQAMWALSRSIEDNIRFGKRRTLRTALGMMPYAENFHAMYSGLQRDPASDRGFAEVTDLDHYAFEPTRKSVAVQLETRSWWLAVATAIVGSVMALALSSIIAVSNLAGRENKVEWPPEFVWFAAKHPIWLLSIFFAILWLAYEWIYREALADSLLLVPVRFCGRLLKAIGVSLRRRWLLSRRSGPWIVRAVYLAIVIASIWAIVWVAEHRG